MGEGIHRSRGKALLISFHVILAESQGQLERPFPFPARWYLWRHCSVWPGKDPIMELLSWQAVVVKITPLKLVPRADRSRARGFQGAEEGRIRLEVRGQKWWEGYWKHIWSQAWEGQRKEAEPLERTSERWCRRHRQEAEQPRPTGFSTQECQSAVAMVISLTPMLHIIHWVS